MFYGDYMKFNIKNFVLYAVLLVLFSSFVLSLFKIVHWVDDSKESKEQIDYIMDSVVIEEEDEEEGEVLSEEPDPYNPYWDFIKMSLMSVDLSELKSINPDTVGWINVGGTNINYPIVQSIDNDFYLSHSFDKSYNDAGWVFMDYRNSTSLSDKNTIIYAHSRFDNTMFGTLRNVLSNGWLNNSDNYIVRLSTETENTLWQVFSVYKIPTTSDYLAIDFDDNFLDFVSMLKERSQFDFNTNVSEDDRILTLSTCYNDTSKVVMHAKLIKIQQR